MKLGYAGAVEFYRRALRDSGDNTEPAETPKNMALNVWGDDWLLRDPDGRDVAAVSHVERVLFDIGVRLLDVAPNVDDYYGYTAAGKLLHQGKVQFYDPKDLKAEGGD